MAPTTVVIVSSSVVLPTAQGQDYEFSLPQLILMDTMKSVDSFTAVLQSQPLPLMHPLDRLPIVTQA